MGLGPIPASKIRQYSREELGLEDDADDRFYAVIRRIDTDYVAMCNDPSKRPNREVSVDDVEGVKAIFSDLESRGNKRIPGKLQPKK
jgi:hypothetical protein